MKITLSFLIIFMSFLMAYYKISELKKIKIKGEHLMKLAEKIKDNLNGEMLSVPRLYENYFNEHYNEKACFSYMNELIPYLNKEFSDVSFIEEYIDILSKFSTLTLDELYKNSEKLINISEKGCKETQEKYNKDSQNAYILFPGIAIIFLLILL